MEWPPLVPELSVFNFEESINFYTNVLGFEVENLRESPKFAYLKLDMAHVMLEEIHSEGWNVGELTYPLGQGMNFQIECKNAQLLLNKIRDNGFSIYRDIKESWYQTGDELSGFKEFLVQDPNGYLLRFSEYLGEKPVNA